MIESKDSEVKLKVPKNVKELFDMMNQNPDICGHFYITANDTIEWGLYDSAKIEIVIDPEECCLDVCGITHWHPTIFEIYDEVTKLGKRGNVLVIRTFLFGASLLYMGDKQNCPYEKNRKPWFGKIHYLEAK